MKRKRYFCEWFGDVGYSIFGVEFGIAMVVLAISSLIYYHVLIPKYVEEIEAYPKETYEYLADIADTVIGKDGINVSAIPTDVVSYEIICKDDKITFTYTVDNNKESKYEIWC